jgi:hypothetical protein
MTREPEDPITERYQRWVRCSCHKPLVRERARLAQEARRKEAAKQGTAVEIEQRTAA